MARPLGQREREAPAWLLSGWSQAPEVGQVNAQVAGSELN